MRALLNPPKPLSRLVSAARRWRDSVTCPKVKKAIPNWVPFKFLPSLVIAAVLVGTVASADEPGVVPLVTVSQDGIAKLGTLRSEGLRATPEWFPYLCLREKGKQVARCLVILPKDGAIIFVTVVIKELDV